MFDTRMKVFQDMGSIIDNWSNWHHTSEEADSCTYSMIVLKPLKPCVGLRGWVRLVLLQSIQIQWNFCPIFLQNRIIRKYLFFPSCTFEHLWVRVDLVDLRSPNWLFSHLHLIRLSLVVFVEAGVVVILQLVARTNLWGSPLVRFPNSLRGGEPD